MTAPVGFRRFPDAAKTIAKILGESVTAPDRAGTRIPDNLAGLLPYIRVVRVGGYDNGLTDIAVLDVDVLAEDVSSAELTSELVREKLTGQRLRYGPAIVDRIDTNNAPQEVVPWAPDIVRFISSYTATFRRYTIR